jgi:hypothetical protein
VLVLVRRVDSEDDPVAQERQALADQRAALEALKRQLAERITAVKEREEELRSAISRVEAGKAPAVALPPRVDPDSDRLAARSAAVAERERAVAAREAALASGQPHGASGNGDAALTERAARLDALARELDARERALEERERIPPDPDAFRLAVGRPRRAGPGGAAAEARDPAHGRRPDAGVQRRLPAARAGRLPPASVGLSRRRPSAEHTAASQRNPRSPRLNEHVTRPKEKR